MTKGTSEAKIRKTFLAIFRNKITTIRHPRLQKGVSGGGGGNHVFRFEGP